MKTFLILFGIFLWAYLVASVVGAVCIRRRKSVADEIWEKRDSTQRRRDAEKLKTQNSKLETSLRLNPKFLQ